jgi:hypothetical protein
MSALDESFSHRPQSEVQEEKRQQVFSLPEWTRSDDLAVIENNCRALSTSIVEDRLDLACALARIADNKLYKQAGYRSLASYLNDSKKRLGI